MVSVNKLPLTWPTIMTDATLARMEHGKYVGVREESRRDGVWALRKRTPYVRGTVSLRRGVGCPSGGKFTYTTGREGRRALRGAGLQLSLIHI